MIIFPCQHRLPYEVYNLADKEIDRILVGVYVTISRNVFVSRLIIIKGEVS